MTIRNFFLLVLVSLSAGLFSGCANTAAKRTANGLDLDLTAKSDEGYVVFKVVTTQPVSILNPKWQSIKISSGDVDDEILDITPTYNMLMGRHVPTESLYFAKLKKGDYKITGLGSVGPGPGLMLALLMSDNAKTDQSLPHFSVRGGKLANLGTLVYSPEIKPSQKEQMILLNGPSGKKSARNALLSEAKRKDIPLEEDGGWDTTISASTESERLTQARRLVAAQDIQKSSHSVVSGTHLGVILKKTGLRTWSQETVDTLDRLYSVHDSDDGKTIVGADYGNYFVKNKDGQWRSFHLPQEPDRISYIAPRPDGSALFVMANLMRTRVLLKKSLEDEEPASEITQMDRPPDYLLSTNKELIFAWNIPGISREVVITRIDKKNLSVTTQNEPFWVIDWQALPNGTVLASRMNGLSLYQSIWKNEQKTWENTESPGWYSSYWFDEQNGLSTETSAGLVMVSNQLRTTNDGGKSWTKIGKPIDTKDFAARLVYADKDEILLQSRQFLYSTTDNGETWTLVLPLPAAL